MTTPTEGVTDYEPELNLNDASDLFLESWKDADESQSSEADKRETAPAKVKNKPDATQANGDAEDDEDEDLDLDDDENDTDQSDGNEEDSDEEALEASDDHKVNVTVDGETKTVTVKELKRLFGQEASLTRKSQEVAQAKKEADASGERYMVAAQNLLNKAEENFRPYENIDWMVAQTKLTPEEFSALRQEAQAAYSQVQFLKSETDTVLASIREERQVAYAVAAKAAIAVLERDVPGFNREVYENICNYAVENGQDPEAVQNITDPSVIKFIYKAMRLDALKAKAAEKKTAVKAKAPKRVVKTSTNKSDTLGNVAKNRDSIRALSKTGSRDDAANAFLDMWADTDA